MGEVEKALAWQVTKLNVILICHNSSLSGCTEFPMISALRNFWAPVFGFFGGVLRKRMQGPLVTSWAVLMMGLVANRAPLHRSDSI
jgi:hypothetical protein